MVDQPARRPDDDMHAAAQRAQLGSYVRAAHGGRHPPRREQP